MSRRNDFDRFSTNQQAQRIFASDSSNYSSSRGSTSEERLGRIMSRELDPERNRVNREARHIFESDRRPSSTTVVMGGHPMMAVQPMMGGYPVVGGHPMMVQQVITPSGVAITSHPVSTSSGHVVVGGNLAVGPALTFIGPSGLTVVSSTQPVGGVAVIQQGRGGSGVAVVQSNQSSQTTQTSKPPTSSSGAYIINGVLFRR